MLIAISKWNAGAPNQRSAMFTRIVAGTALGLGLCAMGTATASANPDEEGTGLQDSALYNEFDSSVFAGLHSAGGHTMPAGPETVPAEFDTSTAAIQRGLHEGRTVPFPGLPPLP